MIRLRALTLLAGLCLLAACNDTPAGDGSADGPVEVLEGSVSDAMLPLESVRSQAPLAEPAARRAGAGEVSAEDDGAEDDGAEADGDEAAGAEAGEGPADGPDGNP